MSHSDWSPWHLIGIVKAYQTHDYIVLLVLQLFLQEHERLWLPKHAKMWIMSSMILI